MALNDSYHGVLVETACDETLSFLLWLIANNRYDVLDELLSDHLSAAKYRQALGKLIAFGVVDDRTKGRPIVTSLGIEVLRQMGMSPVTASELASLLRSGRLTIVLASSGFEHYLPNATPSYAVSEAIIRLLGEPMDSDLQDVLRFAPQVPVEVILDIMAKHFTKEDLIKPVDALLRPTRTTPLHRLLAWSAAAFHTVIIDLGYNTPFAQSAPDLVGQAGITITVPSRQEAKWDGQEGLIIQLRAWEPQTVRPEQLLGNILTVRQPESVQLLRQALENRTVLLLGTGVQDEGILWLIRTLIAESPKEILWLMDKKADDANVSNEVHRWLARTGGGYSEVDLESALHEVYSVVARYDRDSQLDRWQTSSDKRQGAQGIDWDWLHTQISNSYSSMLAIHPLQRLTVWAKLLENLHQVDAARRAYEAALTHATTEYERMQIRLRLAALSRTSGEFQDAIDRLGEIKESLQRASSYKLSLDSWESDRLLGNVSHQIGVGYQMLHDHQRAEIELLQAEQLRRRLMDYELAYTVFQRFLNAVRYHECTGKPVDGLAPSHWREWMLDYLKSTMEKFDASSMWNHYANMLHDAAFVLVFRATEAQVAGDVILAQDMFEQGQVLALQALGVRRLLFERRLIAQSEVLVAKCAHARIRLAKRREISYSIGRIYDAARQRAIELYGSMAVPEYQKRNAQRPEELLQLA